MDLDNEDFSGSSELYAREIDSDGFEALDIIAKKIDGNSTILDVGVGSGALGKFIANKGGVADGIEQHSNRVGGNLKFYRQLVVGDLDTINLVKELAQKRYDYIICADVLEHLRRPEYVLNQLRGMLNVNGRLLISVPNVGYAGVIASLINGEFCYSDDGILDRTHLKFYTRKELHKMLSASGLHVLKEDDLRKDLRVSEFSSSLSSLTEAQRELLVLNHPDALTYQFIIEAGDGTSFENQKVKRKKLANKYPIYHLAELFWRCKNEDFCNKKKISLNWPVSENTQMLNMEFPAQIEDLHEVRFDPLDYPYLLDLKEIKLFKPKQKKEIWCLNHSIDLIETYKFQERLLSHGDSGGIKITCVGLDPYFILPIPLAICQEIKGGYRIEFELKSSSLKPEPLLSEAVRLKDKLAESCSEKEDLDTKLSLAIEELSLAIEERTRFGNLLAESCSEKEDLDTKLSLAIEERTHVGNLLAESCSEKEDLEKKLLNSNLFDFLRWKRELKSSLKGRYET